MKTRDLPIETRAAPIEAVDDATRTITIVWTTGAAGDRRDPWTGERYIEELVVSDNAIRMDRLNAGAPVLDSHRAYGGVAAQLAVVERAWIEGSKGLAEIRFPKPEDDPAADLVFRKIKDRILRSFSVGYRRLKIEVDKKNDPMIYRVIDWEPFEISLVTVPFDTGAQVRNSSADTFACEFTSVNISPDNDARRIRMRMHQRQLGMTV